jgi:hypothetical protein
VSWDFIIAFLRPIEPFLIDPDVSDILVNGEKVFVEKHGLLSEMPDVHMDEKSLQRPCATSPESSKPISARSRRFYTHGFRTARAWRRFFRHARSIVPF